MIARSPAIGTTPICGPAGRQARLRGGDRLAGIGHGLHSPFVGQYSLNEAMSPVDTAIGIEVEGPISIYWDRARQRAAARGEQGKVLEIDDGIAIEIPRGTCVKESVSRGTSKLALKSYRPRHRTQSAQRGSRVQTSRRRRCTE
jgi:hypothetical protein